MLQRAVLQDITSRFLSRRNRKLITQECETQIDKRAVWEYRDRGVVLFTFLESTCVSHAAVCAPAYSPGPTVDMPTGTIFDLCVREVRESLDRRNTL
jgi:hypothetical protein